MQTTLGLGRKPRIIVVGDVMLDVTVHGTCSKLANEAPVPVFKESSRRVGLGGCANVAANLAAMGCKSIHLVGRVGCDAAAGTLTKLCEQAGIRPWLISGAHNGENTLLRRQDNHVPPRRRGGRTT